MQLLRARGHVMANGWNFGGGPALPVPRPTKLRGLPIDVPLPPLPLCESLALLLPNRFGLAEEYTAWSRIQYLTSPRWSEHAR